MRRAVSLSLSAVLGIVVACGDGTGPAIERNDPGTGTSTLLVVATIDADDAPGGFNTVFDVTVQDGTGNAVSGATVMISNGELGDLNLIETGTGSGDYTASRTTFPRGDFRLTVTRGTDDVRNVILGGPGVHLITEPVASATVTALQPVTVRWDVPSQARSAWVETRDWDSPIMPDTGGAVIPGALNPARTDGRIRVFRRNEVDLAGGLPGSRLRVTVRQTIEPIIAQ